MVSNLSQCPIGTSVVVRQVAAGSDGRGLRLEDLGFLVGTVVGVERRAALGDPTIYELRGMRIALRKADAVLVEVSLVEVSPVEVRPVQAGQDQAVPGQTSPADVGSVEVGQASRTPVAAAVSLDLGQSS
jgi:ferrous iron transport protein A